MFAKRFLQKLVNYGAKKLYNIGTNNFANTCVYTISNIHYQGLYYKALQIGNLLKMGRFISKLVFFQLSVTKKLVQTH